MTKLTGELSHKWQRYSKSQKMLILYSVVLLVMLALLPIIKVNQLTSSDIDRYKIFNSAMTKTWVITLITIAFMILRNASYKFKRLMHNIFGFAGNDTLVNTTLIFMLIVMFFAAGDSVTLLKQNFSYRIATTRRYLVIGVYLILGLLGTLAAARIHHKKSLKSAEISITNDQHTETPKHDFYQNTTNEPGGLFGEDDHVHDDTDQQEEDRQSLSSHLF